MASVKLVFGGQEIGVYKLDKPAMVVGRDERCDIPIDNLGVSRNHCQFIRRGDGFLLQDMNSSNGTYVNGKRVSEQALTNNDQVLIGKYSMIFIDDGQDYIGAGAAAPPPDADEAAGGMEPMHTYVMDGAKIRERLLAEQGGGAATDPMAPQARAAGPAPVAPVSGTSKLLIAVLILLVIVLLAVVGVILFVVLTSAGQAPAPSPPPPPPGLWMLLSTLLPW